MSSNRTQMEQQKNLHNRLWAIANDLRGSMEAGEFKHYILGLIFYRYLSEKLEQTVQILLQEDHLSYEQAWEDAEFHDALKEELIEEAGYLIEPQYLFPSIVRSVHAGTFSVETLHTAIEKMIESTIGFQSQQAFESLFNDMDLNSTKLGRDVLSRSKLIAKVICNIHEIPFSYKNSKIDVLGDAYEYLIAQFAATAGKKAGEFYTPQQVSKILAKIVTIGKSTLKSVYDPACGSGSLLLQVAKEADVYNFYGQELTASTCNLARMNMLLHDIPYTNFFIKNDDTLENDQFADMYFDAIVANPPYSAKWSASPKFLLDARFSPYGKLPPKSKADYAFVLHMLYHLHAGGTMAVVLPHGVLFRTAAESMIRRFLIETKNYLDAVIGLPANIFFGTSIPTVILVFQKNRTHVDDVYFIDASNDFEKNKNKNALRDLDVDKIIRHYKARKTTKKYARPVTRKEIAENGYNLSIARYIDRCEEQEDIDINAIMHKLRALDAQAHNVDRALNRYLAELGLEEF